MKYGRAARAITLTLPEDVIERLSAMDEDLGRAIVALVEGPATARLPRIRQRRARGPQVAAFGNHAVIVVAPARELRRLPGIQLVPIGDGRALISLQPRYSVPQLELDLRDAIERSDAPSSERETLGALAEILRQSRRSRRITLEERTIIVLESKRSRRKVRARAAS